MITATITPLTAIPDFLSVRDDQSRLALQQLETQQFEIAFPTIMDNIAVGLPMDIALGDYHTPIMPSRFRRWIRLSPKRTLALQQAEHDGAEAIFASTLRIAEGLSPDGTPSLSDIARDTLNVKTRLVYAAKMHPERFGDTKRLDINSKTTVDIASMNINDLKRQIMIEAGMVAEDAILDE